MRKILLSKRASQKLEDLLNFLETKWSDKTKQDFIAKLDRCFVQIQKYPGSCPKSEMIKGLHKLHVTKQTSVYYRYCSKSIYILTFFDNRMDPKKLNDEL